MSLGTASPRRSLSIALLVVVAAAMTMLLSQCRMVSDGVVAPGPGALAQKPAQDCLRDCQAVYQTAQDAEQALHKQNIQACGSDLTCIANEDARHDAVMAQLAADRKACFDRCHHQGGGSGF